jgi:hypothetical protein
VKGVLVQQSPHFFGVLCLQYAWRKLARAIIAAHIVNNTSKHFFCIVVSDCICEVFRENNAIPSLSNRLYLGYNPEAKLAIGIASG